MFYTQKRVKIKEKFKESDPFQKALLKVFVNTSLLRSQEITPKSIQARLISGQGAWRVDLNDSDAHKIVVKLPLASNSLKQESGYIINELVSCKLSDIPKKACKVIETQNIFTEDLTQRVTIPIEKGSFPKGREQYHPGWEG